MEPQKRNSRTMSGAVKTVSIRYRHQLLYCRRGEGVDHEPDARLTIIVREQSIACSCATTRGEFHGNILYINQQDIRGRDWSLSGLTAGWPKGIDPCAWAGSPKHLDVVLQSRRLGKGMHASCVRPCAPLGVQGRAPVEKCCVC